MGVAEQHQFMEEWASIARSSGPVGLIWIDHNMTDQAWIAKSVQVTFEPGGWSQSKAAIVGAGWVVQPMSLTLNLETDVYGPKAGKTSQSYEMTFFKSVFDGSLSLNVNGEPYAGLDVVGISTYGAATLHNQQTTVFIGWTPPMPSR
jgi:hypothetical protein